MATPPAQVDKAQSPADKTETLAWLRRISGDLATVTTKRLEDSLPWYAEMPPGSPVGGRARRAGGHHLVHPVVRRPRLHAVDRGRHLRRGPARTAAQRQPDADAAAHPRHRGGHGGAARRQGRGPPRSHPAVLARGRLRRGGCLRQGRGGPRAVGRAARGAGRGLDPDGRGRRGASRAASRRWDGTATARSACSWARPRPSSTSTSCAAPPASSASTC